MKLYISNLSFMGFRIKRMAEFSSDIGIEIFIECGNDYYWKTHMEKCLKGRKLPLSVHGPCMNMDVSDSAITDSVVIGNFKQECDLAASLGAKDIVMHPYDEGRKTAGIIERRECSLKRLRVMADYAESLGMKLLIENVPEKDQNEAVFNYEQFFELFNLIPNADFILDTGHAHVSGWNIPKIIEENAARLKAYHLHDNDGSKDSHLFIGYGTVDWEKTASAIKKFTPDAQCVLEYSGTTFEEISKTLVQVKALLSIA